MLKNQSFHKLAPRIHVTAAPFAFKTGSSMTTEQMEQRLRQQFNDADVAVLDLTGTADHFEVRIRSQVLSNMSRVAQHQSVMKVFAEELKTGEVHALAIKVIA
jgi:stress-induced morphogen